MVELIRSDSIRGGAHTLLVYYVFVVYVVIRVRGCSVVRRGGILRGSYTWLNFNTLWWYTSWAVYMVEL